MARYFNGTSDYIKIADNAALSLPDGGFTLAGWFKPYTLASATRYFFSHGTVTAQSSCNLYYGEAGFSVTSSLVSDGNTTKTGYGITGSLASNAWRHICLRCAGDSLSVFMNGVQNIAANANAWNGINPAGDLYLGGRNDLAADRFFKGWMAEWAKWDSALTNAQIELLAVGELPSQIGTASAWYMPLNLDTVEKIGGLTVTVNGTTWAEHPEQIIRLQRSRQLTLGV